MHSHVVTPPLMDFTRVVQETEEAQIQSGQELLDALHQVAELGAEEDTATLAGYRAIEERIKALIQGAEESLEETRAFRGELRRMYFGNTSKN